jgi:hypothetical protein
MKLRIRNIITMICMDNKYVLNEEEYSMLEAADSFATKVQTQFHRLLEPFETHLTDRNCNRFVGMAVESFAKEWENKLVQFRFNALGALKLDKEIRNAIGILTKFVKNTRELFQRLSQIGLVLSLEEVGDILEYWGSKSGSIRWRLNANEIRKIMALRTDFLPLQIAQIQL